MATKRDLVEAHQFSRRRLITAFVSGAPGGREVEPARPGRALVGGLALALLVVAGGAVTGLIFGRDEADWKQPGLVISKERGQPYLVSTPEDGGLVIRPVVNVTSARLILGSESEPTYVSEDAITAERIGEPIGILNAPANVPEPQALVQSGWTACTSAESGLQLTLATRPGVSAGTRGRVPRREPRGPLRHRPGGVRARRAAQRVRLRAARRPRHPGQPAARPRAERRRRRGEGDDRLVVAVAGRRRARVGDVRDRRRGRTGCRTAAARPACRARPASATSSPRPARASCSPRRVRGRSTPSRWRCCATARSTGGRCASSRPTASAWPGCHPTGARTGRSRPWRRSAGSTAPSSTTDPGQVPVVALGVAPTSSASSVGRAAPAERRLRDARAAAPTCCPVAGPTPTTGRRTSSTATAWPIRWSGPTSAANLGFADVDPPVVPDPWVKLFDRGVNLSVSDALCPPVRPSGKPCE